MTDEQRIQTYTASIDRTCRWIEHNRSADGAWQSPSSASGYFSLVPFANHVGRRDWSYAALHYVEKTFVADGALRQLPNRDQMLGYVPGWFVWAACGAGGYRVGNTLIKYVQSFQSAQTGALFGSLQGRSDQRGDISFDTTTMGAIALACAGRTQACTRVADFLVQLLEAQPHPDKCFYTDWREPDGLLTDQAPGPSILNWEQPRQHYYRIGLYVMAMLHAYRVTGSTRYLDTALTVYRLTTSRAQDLWSCTLSHKMVWAAANLYALTGERAYVDDACRGADHLVTLQQDDGTFHYPELWANYPPDPWDLVPNHSCQLALWLALTRDALSATGDQEG